MDGNHIPKPQQICQTNKTKLSKFQVFHRLTHVYRRPGTKSYASTNQNPSNCDNLIIKQKSYSCTIFYKYLWKLTSY